MTKSDISRALDQMITNNGNISENAAWLEIHDRLILRLNKEAASIGFSGSDFSFRTSCLHVRDF